MAEQAPDNQSRTLFDMFGKKKEGRRDEQMMQNPPASQTHNEGRRDEQMMQNPPASQTHNAQHGAATHNIHNQAQAAPYYPTQPPHAEHTQVRPTGYEGQHFSTGEAEKQQHTGMPGKFYSTDKSGSSSSSDEEEEGGQMKRDGRKKKAGNVKHSGEHYS